MIPRLRTRRWAVLAAVAGLITACSSNSAPTPTAGPVDIGGRGVFLTCAGESVDGEPTEILVSGYHDSSDVWTDPALLSLVGSAKGPPVFEAVAAHHHVCAYDRPGTIRYVDGTPLTDRSTSVRQPRTAADLVAELEAVLRAGQVPGPYVLVGHSLGGLVVQLYARIHPDQVRGIVLVDAVSATVPDVFGSLWPAYRDTLLNPPVDQMPLPSMRSPDSERVDLDASIAQVRAAPPLREMPVTVLTKTAPFTGLESKPGLPAGEVNARFEQAEKALVDLAPGTPQILATGSDHYIQFSQPDLVTSATELVIQRGHPH